MKTLSLFRNIIMSRRTAVSQRSSENDMLKYPLLSDLFSIDQLDKQGEIIARQHEIDRRPAFEKLLGRLTKNEKLLTEICHDLTKREAANHALFPAGVWLLDNYYLINEQILLARQHLSKHYSRELPRIRNGCSATLPRVYEIVRDLISHVDGRVDESNLRTIIASYQRITPLTLGELWAIPIMLRLALVDNITSIAMRIAASFKERDLAGRWAARMLATAESKPGNVVVDIADMARDNIPLTCAFVAGLVHKLQSHNPAVTFVLTWVEQRLVEQGQNIDRLVNIDTQQQAVSQISMSNSISSLRVLTAIDWKGFVETTSCVEMILRGDPAGVYAKMDFTTRDACRHTVEKISRQSRTSETHVAEKAILLAKNAGNGIKVSHVGAYLIDKQIPVLENAICVRWSIRNILNRIAKKTMLFLYTGSFLLLTALFTVLALTEINSAHSTTYWILGFLMFIGFSHASLALVNWVASITVHPRLLPRMDFSNGIPSENTTLITVPSMLSNESAIAELIDKLEVCYLSNRTDNLYFSLVTDFSDADEQCMPEDNGLLVLAKEGVRRLNDIYSNNGRRPFLFFHRPRTWNPGESCWMGHERKRGKLVELNTFLRSAEPSEFLIEGDASIVTSVKYVITLDADTELPRDCARHMIETMAHPLNTPVYDDRKGRITEGYSILQPRVVSSLPAVGASWYSRIFSSDSGIDPYTRAVSDIYQDLFEEGSFIGKGIYDVDMFTKVLFNRLPDNQILSHDLLEGTYCRAGLVSDIQLVDDFPQRYSDEHARRNRWIRGDWQIAAWIGFLVPGFDRKPVPNPLSVLSRCKIFDNLRRSIVPIALLLTIVVSWNYVNPSWFGLAVVIAILLLPSLPGIIIKAACIPSRFPLFSHIRLVADHTGLQIFQAFFTLAVLPFEAFSNLDAIIRTCWRTLISRRKLLQWTSSGTIKLEEGKQVWGYFHLMATAPLFVILLGLYMVINGVHSGYDVWCMLGIWFFSPVVSWWISRPFVPREPGISAAQYSYLRKIARKTWSYFETFASAEENYLPADNYQEEPVEVVAHRTSPTNIGLMLLSNLGAYDIGYLCAGQLIDKTAKSFKTMNNMSRFKGHFFNWYDTKTLAPLAPQYVSTVDSGNLAGYLLTLRTGLLQIKDQAVFQEQSFSGLTDTLSVLKEQIRPLIKKNPVLAEHLHSLDIALLSTQKKTAGLSATMRSISSIKDLFTNLHSMIENDDTSKPEITRWLTVFKMHCTALLEELQYCAPWLTTDISICDSPLLQELDNNWTLAQLALLNESLLCGTVQKSKYDDTLMQYVALGSTRAQERIRQLDILAEECKEFSDQDYEFLYDHSRNLLVIGYDVTNRRRDSGYYDLLASEARLGSFIGIASGKLPVEHWFRLGRLITIRRGKTVLLSWGGSMFEYLMPQLVMPGYDQTLLGQTCKAVVDWQIDYCTKQGVPWGISESAENLIDASMNYQYRSFGVPGLGFKRDLADDLVITPYASVLALIARPQDACRNMERLSNDGYEGRYGFYEAIDFEATGQSSVIRHPFLIRSFMAHHQGMSFVSLVNFIAGNPMPRRFESDPLFRTTTLLLQERIPVVSPFKIDPSDYLETRVIHPGQDDQLRSFTTPHTAVPEVRLMSNGRYHVMVTASGGGYSRWLDYAVTRWNEDVTMDNCGLFVYINDLSTQHKWSATFQPLGVEPKSYQAIFPPARAEFRRHDSGLDTFTEIAVSSEDDIECRRITINNFTGKSRNIELTSYAEVVLVPPAADASHPAFSNLFMQTEILQSRHAILCSRRPRSPHEQCPWMFHLITVQGLEHYEMSYETDRLAFVGRGRTPATPRAMDSGGVLSNTDGAVLDPIVSIRCRFTLIAGDKVTLCFISGMARSRAEAEALIEKYQDQQLADRVFNLAVIHGKVVLQQLNATESDALLYDRLASSIIYASKYLRANPAILLKNTRGQSNLWAYSLSGDLPIVLLRVGDSSRLELVAKMIQAHAYWRLKGLAVDLVIWNEEQVGYRQALNNQIVSLIAASSEASLFDKAGGVYLRHQEQMSDEDQVLMQAAARLIFTDKNGSLVDQCQRYFRGEPPVQKLVVSRHERVLQSSDYFRQDNLLFFNGWGGFTRDGREYVIQTRQSNPTPMPWVNVVANKQFGTVISQSGGYTWFENAHEFRLTPWYNDPVSDRCGEALYLRDEESGQFWSVTPGPAPGCNDYLNRHGFGYSVFEYMQNNIKSELWIYVDVEAPVKFLLLKVRNDTLSTRKLSTTGFIELVLGENRSKTLMHVRTGIDSKTGAILASNPFNTEFAGRTVFFDVNEAYRTVSGDRTEFIGRNGSLANPASLHNARLSGRVGVGLDPAAALQVPFELAPGQEKDIVFILGAGRDIEDARNLINRFKGLQAAYNARERVWQHWNHTLGAVNIETPDPALNLIANGWLIYQTMSSRLWGRSGYYQSGGAFGYRDQLQDVMALTHTRPDLVREHLLLCASRQFTDGDVQHWWHPPQGRGVRTLISDDYLWLPLVTSDYVTRTGDTGVLDEPLNFLDGRHLNPDEESYYDLPARSSEKVTLYEHCKRAILHGLRYGSHGLPLMGSGDWNDGMNLVGVKGDGESVWLAFFLSYVLKQFTSIALLHDDASFAARCSEEISQLKENINSGAWDGSWYLRAFCDDGTILGTSHNDECKIDAIVQSWAVLSGAGDPDKSKQAMASLERMLIDKKNSIIKLLDPPFDKSALEPGYIKGYVPGIRENGGQYTHAAIWAIMAFAAMGEKEKVKDLLSLINPVNHGSTPELIGRYLVEPYVVAADIYGAAPHTGRGGWTWYTGSASWMYRLILESVLGLQLNANVLTFTPCIPESWKKLTIHYRFKETVYHIEYNQVTPGDVMTVLVDETEQSDASVHLCNDQIEHYISILINSA